MSKPAHRRPRARVSESRPLDAQWWVAAAALVLLVLVVYWPTLNNGFIWDDETYVQNNAALRSAGGLRDIWFTLGTVPQYYPLVHTTFWLEYQSWQLDPRGYHAVNMLLHALSAVLLWRLLKRLEVPGAWLAAAVFAVHPVHVESVAWITERKNVLSCALALMSLLAYFRFSPPEDAPQAAVLQGGWKYYPLALLLYCGALLSKTVTASLPAVILVVLWWKRGQLTWRDAARLVPFLVVGVPLAGITVWMEKVHVGASGEDWSLSALERVLLAGRVAWFYAAKLVWPHPLIFFYPRWTVDQTVWWQYLFPLGAAALLLTLWLARGRIGRGPLAAVLIFGGVLVPALGFFDVFPFIYSYVADHFQYHASIALTTLLVAAAVTLSRRLLGGQSWMGWAAAGCLLAGLAFTAQRQTQVYQNLFTLWESTIALNPSCWAAHYNLGTCLQEQGRHEEAIARYRQALALVPPDQWHRHVGDLLYLAEDLDAAAERLRRALAEKPMNDLARAKTHLHLGNIYFTQDRIGEASEQFQQSLKLNPDDYKAVFNLASAQLKQGDQKAALANLEQVVRMNPGYADAHAALGTIRMQQGQPGLAIPHFEAATRLQPAHAEFQEQLGEAQFRLGQFDQAAAALRRAIDLRPGNAHAHNLLGAVHAERGHLQAAIAEFENALRADPQSASARNNLQRARAQLEESQAGGQRP